MVKTWRWGFVIILMVLFANQFTETQTNYTYPESYYIDPFEIRYQPDNITCGPTCVSMVLKHYGIDASVETVKIYTKTDWFKWRGQQIGGTTTEYVEIGLEQFGVKATQKVSNINELKHLISQGTPCIANVRSGRNMWHFVVVIGYSKDSVRLADPGSGIYDLPIEIFEGSWNFSKDLNGINMKVPCRICGGDGILLPIPFGECDVCGGKGETADWWELLMELVEGKNYTIIVPEKPNALPVPNK